MSEMTPEDTTAQTPTAVPAVEKVGRGLAAATGAVVIGLVLTVVVWRLGFTASITSFAMAAGAVFAYAKVAGADPRRGLAPLVGLIIFGVVLGCGAVIASDAWDAYSELAVEGSGMSRVAFIRAALTDGSVISAYKSDLAFFVGFAVLGTWSTMRRLLAH